LEGLEGGGKVGGKEEVEVEGGGIAMTPRRTAREIYEKGTLPFESLAGIVGMGRFFRDVAMLSERRRSDASPDDDGGGTAMDNFLRKGDVRRAYENIRIAEENTFGLLMRRVRRWEEMGWVTVLRRPGTTVPGTSSSSSSRQRRAADMSDALPLVTFVHRTLDGGLLARELYDRFGIVVRSGEFLSGECVGRARGRAVEGLEGLEGGGKVGRGEAVRVSVAAYNTPEEVERFADACEGVRGFVVGGGGNC